jgi:hypothetical protein
MVIIPGKGLTYLSYAGVLFYIIAGEIADWQVRFLNCG